MARVVVVGGGFAGLSAAARLAKLKHDVTLLESSNELGGRLRPVELDGKQWPLHAETVTLPGVLRDLFRKSGRTIDTTGLDLTPAFGRRHVFDDTTMIDLPMGTRGDQVDAIDEAFMEDRWTPWVDQWADAWDAWRRGMLDSIPTSQRALGRDARKALDPRRSLKQAVRRLHDDNLREMALGSFTLDDNHPHMTPAFIASMHYVERNFGRWNIAGGRAALADALTTRLAERKVEVRFGTAAIDVERGTPHKVITESEEFEADVVVWAAPNWPNSWGSRPGMPAMPAARTFIELGERAPALAPETMFHSSVRGITPMRVFHGGDRRWTIEHRAGEDPLDAIARYGTDLRDHVVARHDFTPAELAHMGFWGWSWLGFRSGFSRPGVNPKDGVFFTGASGPTGGELEHIGMNTAAIATAVGHAPKR